ncbi:MAG: nucleotidyl transferase AbiEii/AbiGii toxin family protein [Planctomycetota bacterium]
MTAPIVRPASAEGLFLWVVHRFSELFGAQAILKGGMALRLLDCPRSTTDLDYIFVPFESKRDIESELRAALGELEDALVEIELHSKMLRVALSLDDARIQIEATVARSCDSELVGTASIAIDLGQPPQVVRILSVNQALAHKLAAWNERRLFRDLYDIYFLRTRLGASPDQDVLEERLAAVHSRLPRLRSINSMTSEELVEELRGVAEGLEERELLSELDPLLPDNELAGLTSRIRVAVLSLADTLAS